MALSYPSRTTLDLSCGRPSPASARSPKRVWGRRPLRKFQPKCDEHVCFLVASVPSVQSDRPSSSTSEISPSHLCMLSADGTMADLNKKIDYAVGLDLSLEAVRTLQDVKKSINQTSTFMSHTPIFLNVEVKRYASARNPRVQLAAWIAAEFNKRQMEGWPLDMPVLAVEIEQDSWLLHVVAAEVRKRSPGGFILHFFGPVRIGDTFSESNTRKLFSNLCGIALWGQVHFRQWVEKEILTRYTDYEEE